MIPPPVITRPLIVEEADVALIAVVWRPPANVEVAVVVEMMEPVVRLPMELEEVMLLILRKMLAKNDVEVALVLVELVERRFGKVEVAVVEVEVMEPVVNWPIEDEAKYELTRRPMVAKKEVEVALVAVALVTTRVEIEVEAKVFAPVQMLVSERSVDEAKLHVEVEKEYRRPDEVTPTAPVESDEIVTEEVAVSVPTVRLPAVDDDVIVPP